MKEVRRERLCEYALTKGAGAHYIEGGSIWDVACDIALPCATQNELTGKDATTLIKNGVQLVREGANMPSTPDAVDLFHQNGVMFAPRSEEHTSELQSLMRISYAVFCLKKTQQHQQN